VDDVEVSYPLAGLFCDRGRADLSFLRHLGGALHGLYFYGDPYDSDALSIVGGLGELRALGLVGASSW
jgi:hypothetical protein